MSEKISILCVEDGSVDLDELTESGLQDGKVLVYRQGATPPFVLTMEISDTNCKTQVNEKIKEFAKRLKFRAFWSHPAYSMVVIADDIDEICKELTEGE